jgi:pantoate--beta-alanine ligase
VATVVLKLFNLVQPDVACFGRKDYQQSLVVRRMVEDLDLPIRVRVCPTVREADGLALSSRNRFLSPPDRERALAISRSLRLAAELVRCGTRDARTILERMRAELAAQQLAIDYVALADPDTLAAIERVEQPAVALIAARVGGTRLIDNELIG